MLPPSLSNSQASQNQKKSRIGSATGRVLSSSEASRIQNQALIQGKLSEANQQSFHRTISRVSKKSDKSIVPSDFDKTIDRIEIFPDINATRLTGALNGTVLSIASGRNKDEQKGSSFKSNGRGGSETPKNINQSSISKYQLQYAVEEKQPQIQASQRSFFQNQRKSVTQSQNEFIKKSMERTQTMKIANELDLQNLTSDDVHILSENPTTNMLSKKSKIDFHGVENQTLNVSDSGTEQDAQSQIHFRTQKRSVQMQNNDMIGFSIQKKRNQSKSSVANPSSRSTLYKKIINQWETFDINEFKQNMQDPGPIIEQLKQLSLTNVPFMGEIPRKKDIDSTDPLESFMMAFLKVADQKSYDFNDEVKKNIHLATGTRTEFCQQILTYICHYQKLEETFRSSINFFMNSLENVVKLEESNKKMKNQNENLLSFKSDGIVEKFNLDKHLKEQQFNLEKAQQKEEQALSRIKQLQIQIADKKYECESLQYRLNHFMEQNKNLIVFSKDHNISSSSNFENQIQEPVQHKQPSSPQTSESKRKQLKQTMSRKFSNQQFLQDQQLSKIVATLQEENENLVLEVNELKSVLEKKNDSKHISKLQELFNKIQIENKNIRIYNQNCETKISQKQILINLLEQKLTSNVIEKEEIIIKLKSEIVLQKERLDSQDQNYKQKMEIFEQKITSQFQKQYDEQIKELNAQKIMYEKQSIDLRQRLDVLFNEHQELSKEFKKFRSDKEEQEKLKQQDYKTLEEKLVQIQNADVQKIKQLHVQIEETDNLTEVLKKENSILQLRLKYFRQQTETLVKQKVFLFETLSKGDNELSQNLNKMENSMLESNNNQEYLVPVKRCIRQAKEMADLGKKVLQNITQIVQFLKIEKLHSLISSEYELQKIENNILSVLSNNEAESVQQNHPDHHYHLKTQTQSERPQLTTNSQVQKPAINMIEKQLRKIGAWDESDQQIISGQDLRKQNQTFPSSPDSQDDFKNFIENFPFEIQSILLNIISNLSQIKENFNLPQEIQKIIGVCNQKKDKFKEYQIQNKYFTKTSKQINDQLKEAFKIKNNYIMIDENKISKSGDGSQLKIEESNQILSYSQNQKDNNQDSKFSFNIQNQNFSQSLDESNLKLKEVKLNRIQSQEKKQEYQSSQKISGNDLVNVKSKTKIHESFPSEEQLQMNQYKLQIETLKNNMEQQKLKYKKMLLEFAGKIVTLEEQIEKITQEKEDQMKALENTHINEIQKAIQGIDQKEAAYNQTMEDLKEQIRSQSKKLDNFSGANTKAFTVQQIEQNTHNNMYQMMREEYEQSFQKNNELIKVYQDTINHFVYLRENLRGSFTLAFEIDKLNNVVIGMLTESMLKYYLSKVFQIDKSKFRFLKFEDFNRATTKAQRKPAELDFNKQPSSILKLIIEVIVEDHQKLNQIFRNIKSQIKDGTCLLYDFNPLYFGMNLGSSGFSSHHNLKEFMLIQKLAQNIQGIDFVVSIMRHKNQPLIFKIIALNLQLREEFMMELNEQDVYELIEGKQNILMNFQPDELINKISSNLNIIFKDGIKILTCDQKIFFNELWIDKMESEQNSQTHKNSKLESLFHGTNFEFTQRQKNSFNPHQSFLQNTAVRSKQITSSTSQNNNNKLIMKCFKVNVGSQTDFLISDLYEGFQNVFRDVQNIGRNSRIRFSILEAVKSKTLLFTFDDLMTLQKIKFSIYQKNTTDQYVIHTECLKLSEGNHIIVTIEQIQDQCLLVRMNHLQACQSIHFVLVRKQNGQYTKIEENYNLDILINKDFRSFLYDLQVVANKQDNELLMQNYQFLFASNEITTSVMTTSQEATIQNQKNVQSQNFDKLRGSSSVVSVYPKRKRSMLGIKLQSFTLKSFQRDKFSQLNKMLNRNIHRASTVSKLSSGSNDVINISDWRDNLGNKGSLLYRDIFIVRYVDEQDELYAQESLVSFYSKDFTLQIEVLFTNSPFKVSFASEVSSLQFFGQDEPLSFSMKERVQIIEIILDKIFIISQNGVKYIKIIEEAIGIQAFLDQKKGEVTIKGQKDTKSKDFEPIFTAQKMREIQEDKHNLIDQKKATTFSILASIEGQQWNVYILFLKKNKGKTEKSGGRHNQKKLATYGKKQQEIQQMQIEEYFSELDWDYLYLEMVDQTGDQINQLFDKKKISQMLSRDEYLDWKSTLSQYETFVRYIKESLKVNKRTADVYFENNLFLSKNIFEKYKMQIGGKYFQRVDSDLTADEKILINRKLILNQELELSEYIYDIKVFEIYKNENFEVISYQVQIFAINEPNIVYQYNYPIQISGDIQDSHTLVFDQVNLIEHPFKKYDDESDKNKTVSNTEIGTVSQNQLGQQNMSNTQKMNFQDQSSFINSQQNVESQISKPYLNESQNNIKSQTTKNQLFRKYIDNRFVLMIQEFRFPMKLDFILVEPSSQIVWRSQIEPRIITSGASSMNLMDQSILEMFMTFIIDENQNQSKKLYEYQFSKQNLQDLKSQNLMKKEIIEAIEKNKKIQEIEVEDSFYNIKESSENSIFLNNEIIIQNKISLSIKKQNESFQLTIKQPKNHNSKEEQKQKQDLIFRIRPQDGDTQFQKIINCDSLNQCVLLVKIQGQVTQIKMVLFQPTHITTIFKFTFKNLYISKKMNEDSDNENKKKDLELHNNLIFTSEDYKRSILDGLRRYYGSIQIEQALRAYDYQQNILEIMNDRNYEKPTIFEKMDETKSSIHQTRMLLQYQEYMQNHQIILFRKPYYDEQREKLVLMYININVFKEEYEQLNTQKDVQFFNIDLIEPETGQEASYQISLQECMTPDEYQNYMERLKDIKFLKIIAKQILEDRLELKNINLEASQIKMSDDNNQFESFSKQQANEQKNPSLFETYELKFVFQNVEESQRDNMQQSKSYLSIRDDSKSRTFNQHSPLVQDLNYHQMIINEQNEQLGVYKEIELNDNQNDFERFEDEDNFIEIDDRLQVGLKDGVEIDLINYNQNQSAIEERASIEEEDQTSKN